MQSVYLLTGNAIFPEDPMLDDSSVVRLYLEDITTSKVGVIRVAEETVSFDSSLSIFKYLTFEFGGFDLDPSRQYRLGMHVDKNGNGKVEPGDYVTKDEYPILTGLEEISIQLARV